VPRGKCVLLFARLSSTASSPTKFTASSLPGPRSHGQSARILYGVLAVLAIDCILRGGRLVYMMERRQIEGRDAATIAADLTGAFDKLCAKVATN